MVCRARTLFTGGWLLTALLLTGCQDTANDTETAEEAIGSPLAQPASPPRRVADPEQVAAQQAAAPADREALRERVREERERRVAESTTDSRRAMVRQRQLLADGQWWRDEPLAASLALDNDQTAALDRAFDSGSQQREQDARRLLVARRSLNQALGNQDRALALEQLDEIETARVNLARGQTAWLTRLIDILNDEQLARLASDYPQLLIGRQADND